MKKKKRIGRPKRNKSKKSADCIPHVQPCEEGERKDSLLAGAMQASANLTSLAVDKIKPQVDNS